MVRAVRKKFKTQWLELIWEGGQAVAVDTDFGSDAQPRLPGPDGVSVANAKQHSPLGWAALRGAGAGWSAALLAPGYSGGLTVAPLAGNVAI